jgi:hypothetical protein
MQIEPLWDKFNIHFSPTFGPYDCLANLERLGLIKIFEIKKSEELCRNPASLSYENELCQWRDKLNYLSDNKPAWCVPKGKYQNPQVVEVFRAVVVEVTEWGKLLGESCRAIDFFDGKQIIIPAWASEIKNHKDLNSTES